MGFEEPEVVEDPPVRGCDGMMRFVDHNQIELLGVQPEEPVARFSSDGGYGREHDARVGRACRLPCSIPTRTSGAAASNLAAAWCRSSCRCASTSIRFFMAKKRGMAAKTTVLPVPVGRDTRTRLLPWR